MEGKAARLALHRYQVFSIKLSQTNEAGYPDRLFLIPGGRPLFIEFKRPGGKVTPKQILIHERLKHHGYAVAVCDSVTAALYEIERALDSP